MVAIQSEVINQSRTQNKIFDKSLISVISDALNESLISKSVNDNISNYEGKIRLLLYNGRSSRLLNIFNEALMSFKH